MGEGKRAIGKRERRGWRYRANVGTRILAATLGAYLVASLAATGLALLLPTDRTQAVLTATMAAFLFVPAITIWAFLARRPQDALGGTALAAGTLAALIWVARLWLEGPGA